MSKLRVTDFKTIKQLESLGLSNTQIFNITGFSTATISRVRKQGTWSDYLRYKKEYSIHRQGQLDAKKQLATMQEKPPVIVRAKDGYTPELVRQQPAFYAPSNEIAKELRSLNNTIQRLCVAWESTPTPKKGWLKK